MKGKITKAGILAIRRGEEYVLQQCVRKNGASDYCNHTCPLFGELGIDGVYTDKWHKTGFVFPICERDIKFDVFTDDRVEGKES